MSSKDQSQQKNETRTKQPDRLLDVQESAELDLQAGAAASLKKVKDNFRAVTAADFLRLQRAVGNKAVSRLLAESDDGQTSEGSRLKIVPQKSTTLQIQRDGEHGELTPDQRYVHTLAHAGTTQAAWEANLVRNATFLGVNIRRGIHQELVDRLTLAETYLRAQHSGSPDADIVNLIGLYSISGLRAPRNSVGGNSITNHAYGIAIDVNYRGNPFIGRSAAVDEIIARATELMRGTAFHIRVRQGGTLEEIRARFEDASNALRDYFNMRNDRQAVTDALEARGLPTDDEAVAQRMAQIQNDYTNTDLLRDFATTDPQNPRDQAAGFMDLTPELIEALGNQAGLYWGGQYGTGKDMMHFDWRRGTVRAGHRI
jgi:hypothetical protein